jgi:hypothetical protein
VIWRRRKSSLIPMLKPRPRVARFVASRRVGKCLRRRAETSKFAVEQTEPDFEEIEGEIIARTHEIARWRETGEIAYERDCAVRLTLDDERIVRIVVMPGGAPAP